MSQMMKPKIEPELTYVKGFIEPKQAKIIIDHLETLDFEFSTHYMYGKTSSSSVGYSWHSDTGLGYVFGKTMLKPLKAKPFDDFLGCIRDYVEGTTGRKFNSVLVNKYKDGNTNLSYHHDNDPWLGENFIVPSLSFGAKRKFIVKQKSNIVKEGEKPIKKEYILESGSMVIMGESLQKFWVHGIPKQLKSLEDPKKKTGIRFNLTFRNVIPELVKKMPKLSKGPSA